MRDRPRAPAITHRMLTTRVVIRMRNTGIGNPQPARWRVMVAREQLWSADATSSNPVPLYPYSSNGFSLTTDPLGRFFGSNSHTPTCSASRANSRRSSPEGLSAGRYCQAPRSSIRCADEDHPDAPFTMPASWFMKSTCLAGCIWDSGHASQHVEYAQERMWLVVNEIKAPAGRPSVNLGLPRMVSACSNGPASPTPRRRMARQC